MLDPGRWPDCRCALEHPGDPEQQMSDFLAPAGAVTDVCGPSPCYPGGWTDPPCPRWQPARYRPDAAPSARTRRWKAGYWAFPA